MSARHDVNDSSPFIGAIVMSAILVSLARFVNVLGLVLSTTFGSYHVNAEL
jgi:hypothetical protein